MRVVKPGRGNSLVRRRGDASRAECVLSLGELEGDRELLRFISRDSRSISLVVRCAAAVRASASAAVAVRVNSAILAVNSAVFVATRLRRCRTAAEANGPERSPDSVMPKMYRRWRPFGAQ